VPVTAGAAGVDSLRVLRWVAVFWLVTATHLGEAKPGDC